MYPPIYSLQTGSPSNFFQLLVDINAECREKSQSDALEALYASYQAPEVLESGCFIQTQNKQGFMTLELDPISQQFVDDCAAIAVNDGQVLEVGAAYGVASLKALDNGVKLIANDMDEKHLVVLACNYFGSKRGTLQTVAGRYPDEMIFEKASFDAILICRVLHFMDGPQLVSVLKHTRELLKPGGKLYTVNETPYIKTWQTLIPEYERRKQQGIKWPGVFNDLSQCEMTYTAALPSMFHLLDKDTLQQAMVEAGFDPQAMTLAYINRAGTFPLNSLLNGRESIGCIATRDGKI